MGTTQSITMSIGKVLKGDPRAVNIDHLRDSGSGEGGFSFLFFFFPLNSFIGYTSIFKIF